jgi:hypothetical protein
MEVIFDTLYPYLYKLAYFLIIMPTLLVIISAVISSRTMGGTLGQGLKKIAVGTIVDTLLIMTYILIERGYWGIFTQEQVRMFFLISGFFASAFLVSGYLQVYRISKKLKLFTV